jgi:hypothetical protein
VGIPTTVRFKDCIKTFPKFNKPDGNMTWLDFVSQLVELLRTYQVSLEAKSHGTNVAEGSLPLLAAPRDCDSGNNRGRGHGRGNARGRGS